MESDNREDDDTARHQQRKKRAKACCASSSSSNSTWSGSSSDDDDDDDGGTVSVSGIDKGLQPHNGVGFEAASMAHGSCRADDDGRDSPSPRFLTANSDRLDSEAATPGQAAFDEVAALFPVQLFRDTLPPIVLQHQLYHVGKAGSEIDAFVVCFVSEATVMRRKGKENEKKKRIGWVGRKRGFV